MLKAYLVAKGITMKSLMSAEFPEDLIMILPVFKTKEEAKRWGGDILEIEIEINK